MPLKLLCYIDKSIRKQIKFTECLYHKQWPRYVWFSEHVYFVQICPVFAGPVTICLAKLWNDRFTKARILCCMVYSNSESFISLWWFVVVISNLLNTNFKVWLNTPYINCIVTVDALMKYVLVCCQYPMGGLLDKPGRWGNTLIVLWCNHVINGTPVWMGVAY